MTLWCFYVEDTLLHAWNDTGLYTLLQLLFVLPNYHKLSEYLCSIYMRIVMLICDAILPNLTLINFVEIWSIGKIRTNVFYFLQIIMIVQQGLGGGCTF